MLRGREIAVVGGGIAGLSLALALALRGARVRVMERAARIEEVGAGLQISPNGHAVLRALGVAEAVEARAVRGRVVRLRDGLSGRDVLRLDLAGRHPERRFLFVHRADLVASLAAGARAAGVEIETGAEVAAVKEEGEAVRLVLAGGEAREAELAIGADGIHSRLRPILNGAAAPFFTGQAAWRALVPATGAEPPEVSVFMGPGRHLVRYPLRGGALVNIVAVEERREWAAEGWHQRDEPARLRAAFAGFAPEVGRLLERVEEVFLWGLFRHPVARRWHSERLAILGDAAHPTLPFLAQGANMALEDAWVLARCLDEEEPSRALAAYQAARRARVVRAIEAANANARNYHLANPLLRGLAHGVLRLGGALFPHAALSRFEWLYGHDVTAGEGKPARRPSRP
ncbi:salicylate hydroxylase [Meinhardsimonia xiamenensis]|jgi:salicylate hydroxylase|uniref:Salicylate hydroxylase n=1 Tax=Meinhardsimonia xiamenensis TaxID=990712 RepID=A0A1G9BCU9_9RHOB|nr:FAD-dependent monooxygenase [Meinhardsimonia xiamenensis]PRX35024.1 salicylate hydroxylase [Meinhardsimonia xiamenensis]SDK37372.1 salicylate hydroxylase [Meinhardsimonia xiamenensis]